MADLALSSGSICRPYRSPWGAFPTRSLVPISTNARIDLGRLVHLNWTGSTSAGQITQSTADNAFFIVGIAASSLVAGSSATANGAIPVWEANPLVEFKAVTKGGLLASSNIGLHKKIVWDSTLAIQWIDLSASTATDWRVVITQNLDAEGDSGGYVAFRFLSRLTENIGSSVAVTSTSPVLAFYA